MKQESYPYKRKRLFGEPRNRPKEIRVESYDKIKSTIIFIGDNEKSWGLTKDKIYPVIETRLVSNIDNKIQDIYHVRKIKGYCPYHNMNWYFKIKNDCGNTRLYPQTLFKIQSVDTGEK